MPEGHNGIAAATRHRLDGREGVDGSSPSEGLGKPLQIAICRHLGSCDLSNVRWVWSALWSSQDFLGLAGAVESVQNGPFSFSGETTAIQCSQSISAVQGATLWFLRVHKSRIREH